MDPFSALHTKLKQKIYLFWTWTCNFIPSDKLAFKISPWTTIRFEDKTIADDRKYEPGDRKYLAIKIMKITEEEYLYFQCYTRYSINHFKIKNNQYLNIGNLDVKNGNIQKIILNNNKILK